MKIALALAVMAFSVMLVSVPDQIHAAKAAVELPELLKQVETKYSRGVTLKADFSQVNESAATKRKETSSGTILFKRPKKFRWETEKPEDLKHLLISDGKTVWSYTPPFEEGEPGQLIERKAAQAHSPLAQVLLSGSFSAAAKNMKIEPSGTTGFILTPKKGTSGSVARARIDIEPLKSVIRRVVLEHRDGNRSEITLSGVEVGVDLNDGLFHFTPPPNTDRIKN